MKNKEPVGPKAVQHVSREYAQKLLQQYPRADTKIEPVMNEPKWLLVYGTWAERRVVERVARDAGISL